MKTRSSSRIAARSSSADRSSAAACSSSAAHSSSADRIPVKPTNKSSDTKHSTMDDTTGDPKDKNSASTSEGTWTHGENDYAPRSTASPTRSDAMVDSESESFSLYPEVLLTEEEFPTQVSVKDNLETGDETLMRMEDVMPQKMSPSVNVLFTTPARKWTSSSGTQPLGPLGPGRSTRSGKVPVKFNAAHVFLEATKNINKKKSSDTKHSTMDDTTGDPKVESDQICTDCT